MNEEKEYFQTEDNTLAVVEKIKQIIATQKPLQAYQRTARTYTNGAGGLSKAVVAKA